MDLERTVGIHRSFKSGSELVLQKVHATFGLYMALCRTSTGMWGLHDSVYQGSFLKVDAIASAYEALSSRLSLLDCCGCPFFSVPFWIPLIDAMTSEKASALDF
eukprot:4937686-Amphidinium_carterae.1